MLDLDPEFAQLSGFLSRTCHPISDTHRAQWICFSSRGLKAVNLERKHISCLFFPGRWKYLHPSPWLVRTALSWKAKPEIKNQAEHQKWKIMRMDVSPSPTPHHLTAAPGVTHSAPGVITLQSESLHDILFFRFSVINITRRSQKVHEKDFIKVKPQLPLWRFSIFFSPFFRVFSISNTPPVTK